MNIRSRLNDDQLVESRLAARVAGALTTGLDRLPHDLSERLRFAREQALLHARQARSLAPATGPAIVSRGGGAAVLAGFVPWWQRAASVLPLVVLVAGLMAIDHWVVREQAVAAAEFDAQLLADDLPPAAYSDPGFAEFLRSAPAP